MSLFEDLPILAGLALIVGAGIFFVGTSGLPGVGDFDNPFTKIGSDPDPTMDSRYDVTTQINIGSTALGDVFVRDFTYQTKESGFSLSIADIGNLAVLGANNVKADVVVQNQDTGKVYLSNTYFIEELDGGETKSLDVNFDNARPGTYMISYDVTFDPAVYDFTDFDNEISKSFTFEVPKESGGFN